MKKILMVAGIIIVTFLISIFFGARTYLKAAYLFDKHIIAGGLSGSDGIPIKVDSAGAVYIK